MFIDFCENIYNKKNNKLTQEMKFSFRNFFYL